ncbi:hypothetical protein [Pseudarthrobacter sp. NS4]|uniref:hypothetical protein n=1 Tax=Pseudarthrobacter sp. NS4 TaxID=2973976 RepID=UPI00216143EF|nr:hypothetical protein [Pseudarthrobacter sp. NS4]
MPRPEDIQGKSAAEVRTWWLGLAGSQQHFLEDHPGVAGNANGIPFDVRTEANRTNAQYRIEWLNENDIAVHRGANRHL